MTKIRTSEFDVSKHPRTDEDIEAYLEACFKDLETDAAFIAKALGDTARAKRMTRVARYVGLPREGL